MPSIYMFVDPFASMGSTPEEEYDEIEKLIRTLSSKKLYFKRDVTPAELARSTCDIYVFDIGGLCYRDHSGNERLNFCNAVVDQICEKPNTPFVPWTNMTQDYLKYAITEQLSELFKTDEDGNPVYDPDAALNLVCPKVADYKFDWTEELHGHEGAGTAAIRGWLK